MSSHAYLGLQDTGKVLLAFRCTVGSAATLGADMGVTTLGGGVGTTGFVPTLASVAFLNG